MTTISRQHKAVYPERDGRPLGESERHRNEIFDLIAALERRYQQSPDVHVSGGQLLYYIQGDPGASVCPDVFVVKGMSKNLRPTYLLWEEGQPPTMVIEVTSEERREEDQEKQEVYARIGVEELFLHDPFEEYLKPPLRGYRLLAGEYRPIEMTADGSLLSETTGLRMRREGQRVRLIDAVTGEPLLRMAEVDLALQETGRTLRAAQEEIAHLRRELEERGREG